MQTQHNISYDIRIAEPQRALLAKALATFINSSVVPGQVTQTERQEALEMLDCIASPDDNLKQDGINDLTPIFGTW